MKHIKYIVTKVVSEKAYCLEISTWTFSYHAPSRHLYHKLAEDYKLPSMKTTQNVTSKVTKMSDWTHFARLLTIWKINKKQCVHLIDEIYLKRSMLYHGGGLF